MRAPLRDSMSELMQFANNEPNKVTVKKYTLNNLQNTIRQLSKKSVAIHK